MQIKFFEEEKDFIDKSANFIYKLISTYLKKKKIVTLMLSGGKTPIPVYKKLGEEYKNKINWQNVHLFWGDERYVDKSSDLSNFKPAFDSLISKIEIPDKNVHRIKTELEPEKAAKEYEKEIVSFFENDEPVFDLIMLGLGNDGHTASIFPDSEIINENERLVVNTAPYGSPKVPRITVTYKILDKAENILFLSSHKGKEQIIDQIIKEPKIAEKKYPAAKVKAKNIFMYIKK